jgi:hypothetical protein
MMDKIDKAEAISVFPKKHFSGRPKQDEGAQKRCGIGTPYSKL